MLGWFVAFAVAGACEWSGPVEASDLRSLGVFAGGVEIARVHAESWERRPVDVGVTTGDGAFRVRLAASGIELTGAAPVFPMWAALPLPTDRPSTWWIGPVVATPEASGVGVAPRPSRQAPALAEAIASCEVLALTRAEGVLDPLGGPGAGEATLPRTGVRLAESPGGKPTVEVPDHARAVLLEAAGEHARVRATDGSVAVIGWLERSVLSEPEEIVGVAGGVVQVIREESAGEPPRGRPVACSRDLALRTGSGIEFGRVLAGTALVHEASVEGHRLFPLGGPFLAPSGWAVTRVELAAAGCAAMDPGALPPGLGRFGLLLAWAVHPATGDVDGWTWGATDAFFEGRIGDVDLAGVISPRAPDLGDWLPTAFAGRYEAVGEPVAKGHDARDADGSPRHREVRCVDLVGEGPSRGVACTLASNDVRMHVAAVGPGVATARAVARRYDVKVLALLDDWRLGR